MLDPLKQLLEICLSTTEQIQREYSTPPPSSSTPAGDRAAPQATIGDHLNDLLTRQTRNLIRIHEQTVHGSPPTIDEAASNLIERRLWDLQASADEKFDLIKYDLIPKCWRQLCIDVHILLFHFELLKLWLLGSWSDGDGERPPMEKVDLEIDVLVYFLDSALIKAGGALARGQQWCNRALELLEEVWESCKSRNDGKDSGKQRSKKASVSEPSWDDYPSFSEEILFQPPVTKPIERLSGFSMEAWEDFLDPEENPNGVKPLIFTDLITDWPALTDQPWKKPAYLLSRMFGGRRLVPIEIGRTYLDAGWTQKVIRFGQFLTEYVDPSISLPDAEFPSIHRKRSKVGNGNNGNSGEAGEEVKPKPPIGYLAQHNLLSQIPSLRQDILLPDYLWSEPPRHPLPAMNNLLVHHPEINAWFGPRGTVTPLHTDSMHNLLCQVVGWKYVRLYPYFAKDVLFPMGKTAEGINMSNSASVDVGVEEGWDERPDSWEFEKLSDEQRKRFKEAEYVDCVLGPGETLYIPIGWWHYVRSLTVSFSVSFWWN